MKKITSKLSVVQVLLTYKRLFLSLYLLKFLNFVRTVICFANRNFYLKRIYNVFLFIVVTLLRENFYTNKLFLASEASFIAISLMVDKQASIMQLPTSYEWYREQIAGHHPSVIKNGEHQIGSYLIFFNCRILIFRKIVGFPAKQFSE